MNRFVKSHLIQRAQRLTLVNTMISLFDYGDTVWGDRNNQCLTKTLQFSGRVAMFYLGW